MPDNSQKIKLAESVLAAHKQKLPSATNKDQIRRQIAAIKKKLAELRDDPNFDPIRFLDACSPDPDRISDE